MTSRSRKGLITPSPAARKIRLSSTLSLGRYGVKSRAIRRSETGAAGMSSGRISGAGRRPSPERPGEKGWALTALTVAAPAQGVRGGAGRPLLESPDVNVASLELSAEQIRVLGCLLEKQRTTPDTYPLSLNALRLACNQS